MRKLSVIVLAAAIALSGCSSVGGVGGFSSYYSLVEVKPTRVGDGSLVVTPPRPWNKTRPRLFDDVRRVEDWTQNGPLLDDLTFVSGLRSGQYLVRQRRTEERQVPKFRADMTAPEITSMLESLYRVRGGATDFRTLALAPRQFLGANGFQFDYEHLDSDEVWRRGRGVGAVIDGKLYMILFDATRSHYFAAGLPDFEALVASARRRS